METAFDFQKLQWSLPFPERVEQYNVVYLTPPGDPLDGMPLGNGRLGALIWFENSCVRWQLNRCDLFSEIPRAVFHNWQQDEEEFVTSLRHAGQGELDFSLPVFDPFYLEECRGELDIAHGLARMRTKTPFGMVALEFVLDYESDRLLFRVQTDFSDAVAPEFILERYGSRTYSHWYRQVRRDPSLGLFTTESHVCGENYDLTVHLNNALEFAVGGTLPGIRLIRQIGRFRQTAVWPEAAKQEFCGSVGCTPPVKGKARELLHRENPDFKTVCRRTAAGWKHFWSTFLMDYGDEYLNQLYHLALYYLNASQRGEYPGRFINGLWGWNRDVQNWNFYFHWNQQQLYWGIYASGHSELALSYLNLRWHGMESGMRDAETFFQVPDAVVVSDVTDKDGANSASEFANHTPAGQIALDFYRYFLYTDDLEFLRKRAYPYMKAAAQFLESRLVPGPDGKMHTGPGSAYEGWIMLTDTISEISTLEALLDALLDAGALLNENPAEQLRRRQLRANLAAYPEASAADYLDIQNKLKYGSYRGKPALGNRLLAAGINADGTPQLSLIPAPVPETREPETAAAVLQRLQHGTVVSEPISNGMRVNDGIFPWVELCPVFPAGIIGIAQKGSALYQKAVDTFRTMTPASMGWCPLPIAAARLGLAEETARELREFSETWQWFRNGFFHYGPSYSSYPENTLYFLERDIRDCDGTLEDTFPGRLWAFRHMGMEAMGILTATMNEALLQCHEGVVRVFPACDHDASFSLYAYHRVRVDAEKRDGKIQFVALSHSGALRVKIVNPWHEAVVWPGGNSTRDKLLELDFADCGTWILLPPGISPETVRPAAPVLQKNHRPRYSFRRRAIIGTERMF